MRRLDDRRALAEVFTGWRGGLRWRKGAMHSAVIRRFGAAALAALVAGCASAPVVVDYAEYRTDPQRYREADAVVRIDLATLLASGEALAGRKVELSGPVDYRGHTGFFYWHFYLIGPGEQRVRCYEREYRIESWVVPRTFVQRANSDRGTLTVNGRYEPPLGIELDWIAYDGQRFDTDYLPPRLVLPWW